MGAYKDANNLQFDDYDMPIQATKMKNFAKRKMHRSPSSKQFPAALAIRSKLDSNAGVFKSL